MEAVFERSFGQIQDYQSISKLQVTLYNAVLASDLTFVFSEVIYL